MSRRSYSRSDKLDDDYKNRVSYSDFIKSIRTYKIQFHLFGHPNLSVIFILSKLIRFKGRICYSLSNNLFKISL